MSLIVDYVIFADHLTPPTPIDVKIEAGMALGAILEERDFQDTKWGTLASTGGHTIGEWILLIEDELQEAKRALIKGGTGRDATRAELIQVGALVLAALEQHGIEDPHEGRQV